MVMAAGVEAAPVVYDYQSTVGGLTITGELTGDSSHPTYIPGGTVQWNAGITAYKFVASQGMTTETIDSAIPPHNNPQTVEVTFAAVGFPAIAFWDISTAWQPQYVTVKQPADPGYEQWQNTGGLGGFTQPCRGIWTARDPVPAKRGTLGAVKGFYR